MSTKCARHIKNEKPCDVNIDTLIERLKKMRALNCSPYDVGLDDIVWRKFIVTTRSHLVARMF